MVDNICIIEAQEKERKKMENLIVLNTVAELTEFLNNNNTLDTLVGRVAFASDLLDHVRANGNVINIDEEIGFMDDGGDIEVDDMGYVIRDLYLP